MKKRTTDISNNVDSTRRKFLLNTAPAVGAALAAAGAETKIFAGSDAEIPSIRIPKEIPASLNEAPKPGSFEGQGMTGAEVFAKLCKEEDLAAMFCCPGNYTVINAIAAAGVPAYGGRTEGAMCAAADGFSRVTGEATACSGTEGPGFTHMIMNIAAAAAARTPLLVLASNMQIAGDDREAFIQTAYQQPTTTGMKKFGKRLIAPDRVWEYGAYAFRNMKSGVPGPVHLDFPGEVARARFTDPAKLKDYYTKEKYRCESHPHPAPKEVAKAVELITKAERPILIAGHGVFHGKAWDVLKQVVEKHEMAVVTSGPSRGHFPDDHRLSAAVSPDALMSADLAIFIGQYCMPSPGEYRFNPDIKTIRVHPVPEDLGRNWPLDLGIVADEKIFLEALANNLPNKKRDAWTAELAAARKKYDDLIHGQYDLGLKYSRDTNHLHPAVIGKEVHDFLYKGDIDPKQTVTGLGGWTIGNYTGRWLRANRPGQGIVCAYQYGAIGPDLAMVIGAGAAVQRGVGPQAPYKGAPVLCVTSDAGIAYSMFELETAAKYKIPVINLVYNNNSWGMWPNAVTSARSMHMYVFQENLRYDKMAEGLGARGEYVRTPEELREALKRSYQAAAKDGLSTLINCQALKEFTSAKDYPPGNAMNAEPGCGAFAH
ncbi:MAG: thiamine pyrophosphate-binding protein [Acidobacteria bacterium]|nr:thiamine pyrophosphate-binding protein [Acidobacteriota bacterium]MBI3424383.1 thiamine pyrophosphate-binding protein [Acidobacteriota bacterium]